MAPPFRKVEFDIIYNHGISKEGELLDLGMKAGIVLKSGTWFSMKHPTDGEIRLGQGLEKTRAFLSDNPDLASVIEAAIFEKWAPKQDGEAASEEEPATEESKA